MKKVVLVAVLALIGFSVNAQEGFFAKAGLSNVTAKVDFLGTSVSDSEMGFLVGVGYNFEVSDTFEVEPSILITSVAAPPVIVMVKLPEFDQFMAESRSCTYSVCSPVESGVLGVYVVRLVVVHAPASLSI